MHMHARGLARQYPSDVKPDATDLLDHERPLVDRGEVVVGVDEVGRGALAGPLTVGAVVVASAAPAPVGLTDSKLLTPARRKSLVEPICSWADAWSLGSASADEIDRWGLRLALAVAATRALDGLSLAPTFALVDGSFNLLSAPMPLNWEADGVPVLRFATLRHATLVKGDRASATIAAASVLAKVHRDAEMVRLHEGFEPYEWSQNKGYGSARHMQVLRQRGPSPHHRRTWRLGVAPDGVIGTD